MFLRSNVASSGGAFGVVFVRDAGADCAAAVLPADDAFEADRASGLLGDFGVDWRFRHVVRRRWMHTWLAAFQRLDRRRRLPPYLVVVGYRLLTAAFPDRFFHGALAVARSSAAASGSSTKKWPRCFVTPARRPASSPEPK